MMPRDLKKLIEIGYGSHICGEYHPDFGGGIWRYEDSELSLSIYVDGLIVAVSDTPASSVSFSEIEKITSFLTVPMLSSASRTFTGQERLRLDIVRRGKANIELSVPLRIYSSILRGLIEITKNKPKGSGR